MVAVIVVTRLNGPRFAVNPDLLQRIESAPDTVLTLFDGTKYIVEESTETVIDLIRDDRARVIARSQQIQREADAGCTGSCAGGVEHRPVGVASGGAVAEDGDLVAPVPLSSRRR